LITIEDKMSEMKV